MKKLPLLGGLTPQQFLRDYWHKKPLLIRQAIPGFTPLLSREALWEMTTRDDVESRLVTHFGSRWQIQHGPFAQLPAATKKRWTTLVQGVNLHHDGADQLMQQFRFIPDARLDDLMISYATDGGGVGPHFDAYDVFLLQAHGKRLWRIGANTDRTLVEGMPLKILKNFTPEQEFILEPGDMLYLPPQFAHDGIAVGECMTYSVGFRTPSFQELGEGFLHFMAESVDLPGHYADPELEATRRPAEIGSAMLAQVAAQLDKIRPSKDDVAIFLGEYLSEPKPTVFFDPPERPLSLARFIQTAGKRGVALSRKTRMMYAGRHVFINGESFVAGRADRAALVPLADLRRLDAAGVAAASPDVQETLHAWYQDGWLQLA
ncbi:MAG TPA: cupin domain-containing protein [Noviherbaspirillum sp.]|uniref:ribosomal protein uL16 3-hydroxylase n=1 Tax=Noviherbaspirillum sp. TaxID=1926288 RepID=UPI002D60D800|nr:cupin domain-containing protein [Noviherbaspirillum sp.]HYD97053.1 cupin domain-containing protein [Noviherbaspirillum sp.]